jgi:hypothetical protein
MQMSLAEAISQLRDELREAILEGKGQDVVFTPEHVELELAISLGTELKAGGGLKLLAFLDLSAEAKKSDASAHRIKLTLAVADGDGNPIKVSSAKVPRGL